LIEGDSRFNIADVQTISGITRKGIAETFPHIRDHFTVLQAGAEQLVQNSPTPMAYRPLFCAAV
jgi:hypothetical protein